MLPLRNRLKPIRKKNYTSLPWTTAHNFGSECVSFSDALSLTDTNTHAHTNPRSCHKDSVYTCSHKRFFPVTPTQSEGYVSPRKPFIACCSDCTVHARTHTHSWSRLWWHPNTKPQAVTEAPLYFQSIYSGQSGLYILIMCSVSFPRRTADGAC